MSPLSSPSGARALTTEVAEAVRLREGPEAVAQTLRLVGSAGTLTLKDLARAVHLPVPVLAAMRHELEARGVLVRNAGLALSPLGQDLLAELGGPWTPAVCATCGGTGVVIPERYHEVLRALQKLWERRPSVDVQLDQSFALPESNLRRVLFALDHGAILGKRVLFLGDDDAGSVAVALLARALGSDVTVSALDIDGRVLGYLRDAAAAEGLSVDLHEHDARESLPEDILGQFDTVLTDPPYTVPGLELFLSRALEATGSQPGSQVFLSFGHKSPDEAVQAMVSIAGMGLAVTELRPGFNRYEGASVLAGTSDLYHLAATRDATASVHGSQQGGIYTGELRPRTRQYVCRACGASYAIGTGQRFQTIEALKSAGCAKCGAHRFDQRRGTRAG